ncbi:MAG: hypothetical protein ACFFDK_04085 [Promethearchaeota archaeon]
MAISSKRKKNYGDLKQHLKNVQVCPLCKERIEIGIEMDTLKELSEYEKFPYPHIHLHGNPLHAMLCYIDKHLNVRSIGLIKSIEISRNFDTFKQFMIKWSNPY